MTSESLLSPMESGREDVRQRVAFVLELGRALHMFGASALRLEEVLASVSKSLALVEGQFFSTPTSIFASFGRPGEQHTSLVRVEPGDIDLGRLEEVDRLASEVARGVVDLESGLAKIRALAARPARLGPGSSVLAFTVISGASARFFGGGLEEIGTGCAIGCLTGLLALALTKSPAGARIFELVAATVASLVARGVAELGGGVSVYIATLAGLIALVPGLTLTQSISELASRHLVAGTARLMSATIAFLEIGFGVAVGDRIGRSLFGPPADVVPVGLPAWTEVLAFAVMAPCLMVMFKAPRARALPIIVTMALSFWGTRAASALLGPELGVFAGAFLVGVVANLYARTYDRPAVVPLVPAILMLVPGSVGFRSLSELLAHDLLPGIESAFSMMMIAIAIVAGLLFANVSVSPRRAL